MIMILLMRILLVMMMSLVVMITFMMLNAYLIPIIIRSDLSEKSYNEADGRTAVTSTVHR